MSAPTGLVLPPVAHVSYVESTQQLPDLSIGTLTADTVYLARVTRHTALAVAKLYTYIGFNDGTCAVGVYVSDGTTWTLLGSSGAQSQTGTALNEWDPAAALTLPVSGDLYLAFGTNSATLTAPRASFATSAVNGAARKFLSKGSVYSSGLPATITSPSNSQQMVWVGARA